MNPSRRKHSVKTITFKTLAPRTLAGALAIAAITLAAPAGAHPMLENAAAPAGGSYKAIMRITHGCAGSPTRQVAIEIPAGVRGARPMPKPGWTLEVQREKLAQPYTSHGRSITEDAVRITWTARTREDMLQSAHVDEFLLVAQLPDKAGPLYWPVRQVCEEGRADWVEIPKPGQKAAELKNPAVLLDVRAGGEHAGHQH